MENIFNEVLTKDDSGIWSHCGFTMKSGLCNECDSKDLDDACFTLYCRECGFDSPDCADEALDALLVLAVI